MSAVEIFAVAGAPIRHSRSPDIFHRWFAQSKTGAIYTRICSKDIDRLFGMCRVLGIRGLNITSPLKEEAHDAVDELSEPARAVKAVNTVVFEGKHSRGHNTDPDGVSYALAEAGIDVAAKKVVVVGAGGAARAALYALKQLGPSHVTLVGRSPRRVERLSTELPCTPAELGELAEILDDCDLLVSCVPAGADAVPAELLRPDMTVLDAAYTDSKIRQAAQIARCRYVDGAGWLLGQARSAHRVFFGAPPKGKDLSRRALTAAPRRPSVLLLGMMGSGKTTVGRKLAARCGLGFTDSDWEIERASGMTISEIFRVRGEEAFRQAEREIVKKAAFQDDKVLVLGGGAVSNPQSLSAIAHFDTKIFLYCSPPVALDRIEKGSRPLLEVDDPLGRYVEILDERRDAYLRSADLVIDTTEESIDDVVDNVAREIGLSG